MESTPDLSRIVNLIMQNPELIEQISALSKSEPRKENSEEMTQDDLETVVNVDKAPKRDMRIYRQELLSAMKPYLSENRRSALDSMSSILDIIDLMSRK